MADATTTLSNFLNQLMAGIMGSVGVNEIHLADGVTAPTATVGKAKIYINSSNGDLEILYGDGTTKTIVVDT